MFKNPVHSKELVLGIVSAIRTFWSFGIVPRYNRDIRISNR
jgi:hypothetical protein